MTQLSAAQALRDVVDEVRGLQVHAIDPAYRRGAHDALAAVIDLVERLALAAALGASCGFPDCHRTPDPATGMCGPHRAVRVTASYVDDRHHEGGHG